MTIKPDPFIELMVGDLATPTEATSKKEIRITHPTTGASKGVKLQRYDLIPAEPLRMLAELYGKGAFKYDERNWEKGYEFSKSFSALQRHMWLFWAGEDIDDEMGLPHTICAAWHAFVMTEFLRTHPEMDDRPYKEQSDGA